MSCQEHTSDAPGILDLIKRPHLWPNYLKWWCSHYPGGDGHSKKFYPSNYRGICISSCLGKLFCSILNQRLLEHVQSRDILHESQIGFLANNRTADHVLTLRTLIDKYVHCHKTKIYTHALWTLEKHLIRSGMMDLYINCYKTMSEETFIM